MKDLFVDQDRESWSFHQLGVPVRAIGRTGRYGTYDVMQLTAESFEDWLNSRGPDAAAQLARVAHENWMLFKARPVRMSADLDEELELAE